MTNETIADIIAEMRNYSNDCNDGYHTDYGVVLEDMRNFADRFEAAHKRERGDCAKLREALAVIATIEFPHNFQNERFDIADACQDLTNAIKTASVALSAPPRNCDLPEVAKDPWRAWLDDESNWEDGYPKLEIHDWLFAPATEKEGGDK